MNLNDGHFITSLITHDSGESIIEDLFLTLNNENIPIKTEDLYPLESINHTVIMSGLYNYLDNKDETLFTNVYLPEIIITYPNLITLFFSKCGKYFTSQYLNHFWNEIKGLSLQDIYLKTAESIYNIDYDKVQATTKIRLHKECSFAQITKKAHKIIGLSLEEFNNALKNTDPRIDGSLCSSAIFHLYSEALKVGIKITQRFLIHDIPEDLKKHENDSQIIFDYSNK
jgi:hypothetical protein